MTDHDRRPPLRVAFQTLGCRLNQVDTEGIKEALRRARSVEVVAWQAEADLYILNSCTVTSRADQECRRLARQVKRLHPGSRIVITGCYAQTQPAAAAGIADIDAVIGNPAKERVADWLPQVLAAPPGPPLVLVEAFADRPSFAAAPIREFAGHSRAFVKVQDGCDLRCAYCLIWQARGPARSRPAADVVAQLARLRGEAGFHEAVLTGVHLGSWGREFGADLPDLLTAISDAVPDLRVRLGSLHPDEVTPRLLALLGSGRQLRPHLHLSLQSGSDRILALMRRPYRRRQAAAAVTAARAASADCGIGADLIVGFPGETEADFAATCELVDDLPLAYLHVFRFSPRPGTAAAAMPHQVAEDVIKDRSERLRALARVKRETFLRGLVGRRREAIVESGVDAARPGWRQATTDNYATVLVTTEVVPGTLVELAPDEWRDGRLWSHEVKVIQEGVN